MKQTLAMLLTLLSFTFFSLHANEDLSFKLTAPESDEKGLTVNFQDVSILEFLRFVSEVTKKNFIYDEKILDFNISLVTGKTTKPEKILEILLELLNQQGIKAEEKREYYLLEKMEEWELEEKKMPKRAKYKNGLNRKEDMQTVGTTNSSQLLSYPEYQKKGDFFVYKLQYHVGSEIVSAIKNISGTLKHSPTIPKDLVQAIDSMQWVQSTNSILYSGTENGIDELTDLIQTLDVPKKQVFIEVLVIETDVRKGLEFGLEWAAGGTYKNKFGYGVGNFPAGSNAPFAKTMQEITATKTPTGTNQFPLGCGFDLGIIGDIILHKGKSYLSLGSLVSALQADNDSTIVLNQKIITQDNKLSRIFVGDNLAFKGATVDTKDGASQQIATNIEYRDIGVTLNITPLLGNEDMITLEVSEEITNVIPNIDPDKGINTTKTDMATQVHVPDQSFLVLSGMIRNTKRNHKSGIPCLGGLPLIGAAFSKSTQADEKRNVIIFVRPQIIHSRQEHQSITTFQENQLKNEAAFPEDFQKSINMLQQERSNDVTDESRSANAPPTVEAEKTST
ncbi:MAG: hypothetical protein QNJ27_05700 [Simkaniaceae bacterium]|nr:hypothetical protein [Simkaniaceae bacterium]